VAKLQEKPISQINISIQLRKWGKNRELKDIKDTYHSFTELFVKNVHEYIYYSLSMLTFANLYSDFILSKDPVCLFTSGL